MRAIDCLTLGPCLNSPNFGWSCTARAVLGILTQGASSSAFYTFDPQGNTTQSLNSSETILDTSAFDAFGEQSSTGTSTDPYMSFGAQWGYYMDYVSGLELLTHRYFDSSSGRFINRDPVGRLGGINLYAYCQNNPLNENDALGYEGNFIDDCIEGGIDCGMAASLLLLDGLAGDNMGLEACLALVSCIAAIGGAAITAVATDAVGPIAQCAGDLASSIANQVGKELCNSLICHKKTDPILCQIIDVMCSCIIKCVGDAIPIPEAKVFSRSIRAFILDNLGDKLGDMSKCE